MSLLTIFNRRPASASPEPTEAPQEPDRPDVLMRFLTLGGAVVELHRHRYRVPIPATENTADRSYDRNGLNWRCLGCDAVGRGGRYGLGPAGYAETEPSESKRDANEHAAACRAMPRPATS